MNLRVQSRAITLPLLRPFGIAGYQRSEVRTVITRVSRSGGEDGFGEAVEHKLYGVVEATLHREICEIGRWIQTRREGGLLSIARELVDTNFSAQARSAVDQALWDLHGHESGRPVYELLPGPGGKVVPVSSITIGLDSPQRMAEDLVSRIDWPIFKVKLGSPDDEVCLRKLRTLAPDTRIRIDANGGWTPENAGARMALCEETRVELIEQPFPPKCWEQSRAFVSGCQIPVIADESCQSVRDLDHCSESFTGVNVKLYKCGGITPALHLMERARQIGMSVMLGCMLESIVGVSAAAQLADRSDFLDLDAPSLLASQLTSGVRLNRGVLERPKAAGIGLSRDQLRPYFD